MTKIYGDPEHQRAEEDHKPIPESAFGDDIPDNCTICGLAVTPDGQRHGYDKDRA